MENLVSNRLVLRGWLKDDWNDLLEISLDWKAQPGPEFDKFPVDEEGCKNFNEYNVKQGNGYAIYLNSANKVIGLLGLNGINDLGQMDLGHVIHSKYQDNDIDREALFTVINYIFDKYDVKSIVTHNFPDPKQEAPLYSLGFKEGNREHGELVMEKENWLKKENK